MAMADVTLTMSPIDARRPAEQSSGTVDWLRDNVYHPFSNALFVEPRNALANAVNEGAHLVGHKHDVMSKAGLASVPDAPFLSGQWLAQSVSGCVGMILPYAIAGRAAGGGLRTAGDWLAVENKTAVSVLASEHTARFLAPPHTLSLKTRDAVRRDGAMPSARP